MSETNVEAMREELISLMKSHDWWYGYSDDSRSYQAGSEQRKRIVQLRDQLPDGDALYAAHRPASASY